MLFVKTFRNFENFDRNFEVNVSSVNRIYKANNDSTSNNSSPFQGDSRDI